MQIFILLCDINTIVLHPDPKGDDGSDVTTS